MSEEVQEQRKQISSGSLPSVLSEMQKIITEFKDGMPDYIDKMLKEKLPPSTQPYGQEDRVSLLAPIDREFDPKVQHVSSTLEQIVVGVTDTATKIVSGTNRNTSSPQTSRDIVSPQTNKDVGSRIKIITDAGCDVNKDDSSSGFFFYLGFRPRPFTNLRTARERGGHFFISSLPLPPALQTLRYWPSDNCRELTSTHSCQPDSNREPLVSKRKSLTTQLRPLKPTLFGWRAIFK